MLNLDQILYPRTFSAVCNVDVKPGQVVKVGAYNGFDHYNVTTPAAVTDAMALVTEAFVDNTALVEEKDFVVTKGKRFRCHFLNDTTDIITVSKDILDNAATVAFGDKFEGGAGLNLKKVVDYTANATFKFEVIELGSFFEGIANVTLKRVV